jgi:VWFA-related protein
MMVTSRRVILLVLVLAGLSQRGTAPFEAQALAQGRQEQPPPPQQPPAPAPQPANQEPTFRAGINYVGVDVIVTDKKDSPVVDLKREDFEVFEDGKPQPIEQFRLVRIGATTGAGELPRRVRTRDEELMEAGREDVRVFAILLDDYHTRKLTALSVKEPLTKFLETQLAPNDLVALIYPLTPVSDILFTNDHASIARAVQNFEGRKFDYTPRNRFEEEYSRYPTTEVERIRNEVVMDALSAVAIRMGSMRQGRKSIIYVSEGLTVMLPPQMQRANAQNPVDPLQAIAGAAVQDSPQQQTNEYFNQALLDLRLREVFRDVNRNNASIYALDPRGLAVFEYDIDAVPGGATISMQSDRRALQATQDTLKTMSEQTDGRAIVNRNSLDKGLAQIVRDASFYYLLGYNSTQAQNDGKFHEIKVRVKRPSLDVRARKGYWALTVDDVKRATTKTPDVVKPVMSALATIAPSVQAGKFVRTWVGTERGSNGKTRVTLTWEPLTPPPGTVRREQPGRVALLAANADGALVFRGATPEQSAPPASGPLPQQLSFEVPPGRLELRLTVQDSGSGGTLDQEIKTIEVPDLTAPQAAISTPRVYRARTVREFQTIAADASATPLASREFSRTERLLIRFDAYAAGGEQLQPTAVLLNRAGSKMSDVPIAPAQAGGTHQINLSLAAIPAGEYLVEIRVQSASGEAKELVPFRVGS